MEIEGSAALVTGARSGLGRATAERLAAMGAQVVAVDLACPAVDRVEGASGRSITFVEADVTIEKQVRAAVDRAASLGPLRVVVNCAGVVNPGKVLGRDGPLALDSFDTVVRVNLVGTFNVLRLAAEQMARIEPVGQERGVIVNTASIAAFDGQVGQTAYAASKGGVVSMTLPAARELAEHLVRVVAVAPGTFETPMLASLPQETRDGLAAQVPHPSRFGRPHEFADLVAHIVTNPMINGETIRIDGAIRMPPR